VKFEWRKVGFRSTRKKNHVVDLAKTKSFCPTMRIEKSSICHFWHFQPTVYKTAATLERSRRYTCIKWRRLTSFIPFIGSTRKSISWSQRQSRKTPFVIVVKHNSSPSDTFSSLDGFRIVKIRVFRSILKIFKGYTPDNTAHSGFCGGYSRGGVYFAFFRKVCDEEHSSVAFLCRIQNGSRPPSNLTLLFWSQN